MAFTHSLIWFQVHNMPLGCMNRAVGLKIEGSMGCVEDVAVVKDDVGWGRCLRIRVAINLYHLLDRGRALIITGKSYWVSFRYEKLHVFCFRCGRTLHVQEGCTVKVSKKQTYTEGALAWWSWLQAEEFARASATIEGHHVVCHHLWLSLTNHNRRPV
jgi:hypothetical protein